MLRPGWLVPGSGGLVPNSGGLVPNSEGLVPYSEGLVPDFGGLVPVFSVLVPDSAPVGLVPTPGFLSVPPGAGGTGWKRERLE